MTIEGTSTLHDWISDVTKLEFAGNFVTDGVKVREVKDVTVKIPVESIRSTKGKLMDNKTWEAFKYDKYPTITYKLVTLSVHDGLLKTTGTLTMAGAAQSTAMEIHYTVMPSGDIRFTGSHKIKMKDYKMEPPTAMMGTIKVGEEVTVKFDLTITPNK
ncbi:MAG: YceI family protein [Cyclobacteriaceae bacterium]|nr:YceI family protein [Cyclobacteriaceae bacterium]